MKKRRKASTSSKRDVSSSLCSMLSSSASNSAREKEPRAPTSALLAAAFTSSRVRVTPSLRKARTTSSSSKLCELSRSMEVKSFATLPACLLAIASCIAFAALWCRRLSTSFLSLCTPTSEPCGRRWGWTWSTAELQVRWEVIERRSWRMTFWAMRERGRRVASLLCFASCSTCSSSMLSTLTAAGTMNSTTSPSSRNPTPAS
mmetsp:Transcript_11257/g.25546  ORF Transcript_11257/g.25546 Transcript_11257/m.25546 type:complete len:203 (-) Transcript_11257:1072-1680(-)